jgi:peptidoglycan/xylan/chitin deacetylase (PgdA/CDA1 family)
MPFALTFDDGPGPSMPTLLDELKAASVQATFFVLGRNIEEPSWDRSADREQARAIIVRAITEGHEIGNHSYSHLRDLSPGRFMAEVPRMDNLIRDLRREAGAEPNTRILVRLPFGEQPRDPRADALRAAGRNPIGWTHICADWNERDATSLYAEMVNHVQELEQRRTTAVLTLHVSGDSAENGFGRPWTVAAVRRFLREASRQGWQSAERCLSRTVTILVG